MSEHEQHGHTDITSPFIGLLGYLLGYLLVLLMSEHEQQEYTDITSPWHRAFAISVGLTNVTQLLLTSHSYVAINAMISLHVDM